MHRKYISMTTNAKHIQKKTIFQRDHSYITVTHFINSKLYLSDSSSYITYTFTSQRMANSTDMMTWSQVTKTLHCINIPVLWDDFVGMFCRKELVPSIGSYKFRDTVLIPLPLYSIDTNSRNHICRYDFSDAGDGIIRPGSRGSIPCLLMHCLFMSPVQQQACYWLW